LRSSALLRAGNAAQKQCESAKNIHWNVRIYDLREDDAVLSDRLYRRVECGINSSALETWAQSEVPEWRVRNAAWRTTSKSLLHAANNFAGGRFRERLRRTRRPLRGPQSFPTRPASSARRRGQNGLDMAANREQYSGKP
jgi:hypothetical protein